MDYRGFVNSSDGICIAIVAAAVFFPMESMNLSYHCKTSMNVGALVALVAAVHYFYMREVWFIFYDPPLLFLHRCVDHCSTTDN